MPYILKGRFGYVRKLYNRDTGKFIGIVVAEDINDASPFHYKHDAENFLSLHFPDLKSDIIITPVTVTISESV